MMKMNELLSEIADIRDLLQATIHEHYVYQYIEPPQIDEDKLLFLCSIADRLSKQKTRECVLSAMLVQIALDIHDRVAHLDQLANHGRDKTKQLTVLAGDYYSSVYYKRLANIEEIGLIRHLADGIKEINEQKMYFFYTNYLPKNELLQSIRLIESGMVYHFARAYKKSQYSTLIQEFFLLKRLLKEKKQLMNGELTPWLHAFTSHLHHREKIKLQNTPLTQRLLHNAEMIVDDYIDAAYERISPAIEQMANEKLSFIVRQRLTEYMEMANGRNKQLAEEG